MRKIIILCLVLTIVLLPIKADAFWWLFGKSEDEVSLTYLYISGISYDESGEEITLYRDLLEDDLINIRGRAVIRKGQIGSVLVSVDGKESWESAELSEDGAFQYYFRPEPGQSYEIYIEAMETAGRINDVDGTYKRVNISESDYQQVIDERLAEIFTAYEMRDSTGFMDYVSWDFVGGEIVLEQALNKDFRNFADIAVDYQVVNMAVNEKGMISVVVNYSRRLISNNDGSTLKDSGITEFIFNLEDRGPVLYSMSHPLIFGVSDAVNVASGVINSAENEEVIAVDDDGNIGYKTIDEIVYEEEMDGGSEEEPEPNYESGEKYIASVIYDENGNWHNQGYRFSDSTILDNNFDGYCDFYIETNIIFLNTDVRVIKLNETDINNVKEVPASGYGPEWELPENYIIPNQCYALLLPDGNYSVLFFEDVEEMDNDGNIGDELFRIKFHYKYRDDGGRQF